MWGDDWPYWDQLTTAMSWISKELEDTTGLYLMCKEKYGTMRYEHIMKAGDPHYEFADTIPNWMLLKDIVFKAIDNWPEIKDELLSDFASHDEIVGKEIHDQYWTTL